MIFWIEKEHKNEYKNSAKASGIRIKFYDRENNFDKNTMQEIKNYISFLRNHFYFPVRLNVLFCNSAAFTHHLDKHKYFGAFYNMEDEKRFIYPRISVAAKVNEKNSLEDVLFTLTHEITHYYQWYFSEEDKRSSRSLEIEANRWSGYILNLYFNSHSDQSISTT